MAEALGTVASVLAVIELAAEIAQVCHRYISKVSRANEDIIRLRAAVKHLQSIFEDARRISIDMDERLPATKSIIETSDECWLHLFLLQKRLKISARWKLTGKLTSQTLRWPFISSEIDKQLQVLHNFCQRLQTAMQLDGIRALDNVAKDNVLSKLAWAEGATHDAFDDLEEPNMTCLKETRVDLLQEVRDWVNNPESKSLFWLCGMAGTGKSTISRTLAEEFAGDELLGASFFFKEGEGDRGGAKRFFTTVASQLVRSIPALGQSVRKAIENDPQIGTKGLKEQFEKLILEPLSTIKSVRTAPIVLVIDALDECKPDWHVEALVSLFSRLRDLRPLQLRVFMTSRPERAPREGFQDITPAAYQDLILHEISESVIKHDIAVFLEFRFGEIRRKRQHDLPTDWPGEAILSTLAAKSQPLFIYASTICRFIGTGHYPQSRLKSILSDENDQACDKVHQTYQPVLDRLLEEHSEAEEDQQTMLQDFKCVVGPIVTMYEPLSANSLGKLVNIDIVRITSTLDDLRSLIHVPTDSNKPVRPLHLSFSNFLLDYKRRNTHRFWLDERELHEDLAHKCIDTLLHADCLSAPDICRLKQPGLLRSDIPQSRIDQHLSSEVQYACRFWTRHLVESRCTTSVLESSILAFLDKRFLFWFEALGLLGRASEMIIMLGNLEILFRKSPNSALTAIIYDVKRFALANRYVADLAPLQLYSSSIIFAPRQSIIRAKHTLPTWLGRVPETPKEWGSCRQTLIGHSAPVQSLACSPNGKLLASVSDDRTIKLWNVDSGNLVRSLDRQRHSTNIIVFSPSGLLQACVLKEDSRIEIWNAETSKLLKTLGDTDADPETPLTFSADGRLLATGDKHGHIKLWDWSKQSKPTIINLNESPQDDLKAAYILAISSDTKLMACASTDGSAEIWETGTGDLYQTLQFNTRFENDSLSKSDAHSKSVTAMVFSSEKSLLATGSWDYTTQLWNTETGALIRILRGHTSGITAVAFSSDHTLLATTSWNHTMKLWKVDSDVLQGNLEGHTDYIFSVAAAPNGMLASGSRDGSIRLWDIASHLSQQQDSSSGPDSVSSHDESKPESSADLEQPRPLISGQARSTGCTNTIQFRLDNLSRNSSILPSPSGKMLICRLNQHYMQVWDMRMDKPQILHSLDSVETNLRRFSYLNFSPNGGLLAIGSSEGEIQLWDMTSDEPRLLYTVEEHVGSVSCLQFSDDSRLLASGAWSGKINLWDVASMQVLQSWSQRKVDDISFHGTLPRLITDTSRADTKYLAIEDSIPFVPSQKAGHTTISVQGEWLARNNQRLIWLPIEWRKRVVDASGQLAVVRLDDDRIGFFEVLPEELQRAGLLAEGLQ